MEKLYTHLLPTQERAVAENVTIAWLAVLFLCVSKWQLQESMVVDEDIYIICCNLAAPLLTFYRHRTD